MDNAIDSSSDLRQMIDFLEKFPLLRKHVFQKPITGALTCPALHLGCSRCKREQTFRPQPISGHEFILERNGGSARRVLRILGDVIELPYVCAGCNDFTRRYFLEVSENGSWIRKVGQTPPWEISPSNEIDALLEQHSPLYRKGLVCESQGYGIGAFAYYRRVVEELTDELLAKVEQLLRGPEQEAYHEALVAARVATTTARKFEFVKDHLPAILKPGGADPLGRIYGLLSEGLHNLEDDDCLAHASEIRFCLEFVVQQVVGHARAADAYTSSMTRLASRTKGTN